MLLTFQIHRHLDTRAPSTGCTPPPQTVLQVDHWRNSHAVTLIKLTIINYSKQFNNGSHLLVQLNMWLLCKAYSSGGGGGRSPPGINSSTVSQSPPGGALWPYSKHSDALHLVLVVVLLGCVCAVLGAIYAFLYTTRIRPRTNRPRKCFDIKLLSPDEQASASQSTHVFLFRKWRHTV